MFKKICSLLFISFLCALSAQEMPESLRVYEEQKPNGHNEIVFAGGYAFVIVEFPADARMAQMVKSKKQLSGTFQLIRDYCLAEQPPLKSPFAANFANALQIRPSFRMPKLPCNVVKNDVQKGKHIYVTAFSQADIEQLRERYSTMADLFSLEAWRDSLRAYRQKAQAEAEKFDGFLATLVFPERLLAGKEGMVTCGTEVNLQELYAAVATWNPEKNSVFKSKRVLQSAPGFPPALLVIADDEEKNGHAWKAFALRLNAQMALGKPQEVLALCHSAGLADYGKLLEAFYAFPTDKVALDKTLWKFFGHLDGCRETNLKELVTKAYNEQRFLEGLAAANQLLRLAPDEPETSALLAEGYRQLGLEGLADGAYWYLVSLEKVPSDIQTRAEAYLKARFADSLKP